MKIIKSKILNELITKLYNKDFYYVDEILSTQSDYYTISGKTRPEETFEKAVQLTLKAQKLNLPIVEVECCPGDFSIYFVNTTENVKTILKKYLDKIK